MRRIVGSSELKAKAKLILAVLVLTAARLHAQETQQQSTRQVLISLPDRKLALIEDGEVKKIYPVAIGKATTPSPSGSFLIVNRVTNPAYYHKGQVIDPGPTNPVGTRWIGLNQKGYGIHGTNEPRSIGKAASHGCIRMAKEDLEELFELLRPGDIVEIRDERDDETAHIFSDVEKPLIVATSTTVFTASDGATVAAR